MNKKDTPLQCRIEEDCLVIRIGISTLVFAAGEALDGCKIIDEAQWAKDVVCEMNNENEIGETIVTDMIDRATNMALDNGSEAVDYELQGHQIDKED